MATLRNTLMLEMVTAVIKVCMFKEKNMERVNKSELMVHRMMVIGLKTKDKVMESLFGMIREHMKANGFKTKWKDQEYINGRMERNTKVNS